jgi:hypothetical protein
MFKHLCFWNNIFSVLEKQIFRRKIILFFEKQKTGVYCLTL